MENYLKTKRILKTDPADSVVGNSERIITKCIIDFNKVSDYEEYKGDLEGDKPLTLVLVEHNLVSEWKIIFYDFEDFHKLYLKWIDYVDSVIKGSNLN